MSTTGKAVVKTSYQPQNTTNFPNYIESKITGSNVIYDFDEYNLQLYPSNFVSQQGGEDHATNLSSAGFSNVLSIGVSPSTGINTGFTAGDAIINSDNIFWSIGTRMYESTPNKYIYSDLFFVVNYKYNNGTAVDKSIKYSLSGTDSFSNFESGSSTGSFVNPTSYLSFTGQHRCEPENKSLDYSNLNGYIVSATGEYNSLSTNETGKKKNINIADSLSIVKLTEKNNDKSVYGVICAIEETNERIFSNGIMTAYYPKEEENDLERLYINSLGEGAIWVCNYSGNFENGDYITTCEVPGIGCKQADDILHNYTVAKITCDVDFDNLSTSDPYEYKEVIHNNTTYKCVFVGCTYHCG